MSTDPNTKLAKAILLNAACTLAAAVIEDEGTGKLQIDPTLSQSATQQENVAGSQEVTTFYAWLLQCLNTNGTNADGSANAFVDPTIGAAAGAGAGAGLSAGFQALLKTLQQAIPAGTTISASSLPALEQAITNAVQGVLASASTGTAAASGMPSSTTTTIPQPQTIPSAANLLGQILRF
jgi:hypothetical protein